jgi:hypothetical protein
VGFEGGEAVAEVRLGAVEGCAGKVTYRGDGRAECSAYLAVGDVEMRVAEEAEL